MYNKSAEFYDDIYFSFKDYKKDVDKIITLIKKHMPNCKTILDVACGTGEHAKHLKNKYRVDGVDLNPAFLKIARQKNPKGNYWRANMINFNLKGKYDLILCLFSSIGYVRTLANLKKTFACFAKHLNKGGMIFVEPWLTPQTVQSGKTHLTGVETDRFKICRMALTKVRGRLSIVTFHYLLAKNKKIRHFTETHTLGLFTIDEMKKTFQQTGFQVAYDKTGFNNRGLYIAKKI